MLPLRSHFKDPDEKLDFVIDWTAILDGDIIATSSWTVPVGITTASPAPYYDNTTATIWLSGGTVEEDYNVANKITTTGLRIFERTIRIQVRQR